MKLRVFYVILLLFLAATSCNKEQEEQPEFTGFVSPKHFPETTYPFETNPVTEAGFKLGRKLFYDGRLSRDGSISCGSCHIQYSAFSHVAHAVSHGIDDKLGKRNAPPIQNAAWMQTFMWDGGVHNLDMLPFNPIQNPVEMDETVSNVILKLQADETYRQMFSDAFGSEEINSTRMMQAFSQFMCMLISDHSRYDEYIGGNETALNTEEKEGLAIFRQKCNTCHTEPLFTNNGFKNNGMPPGNDKGRSLITLNPADEYAFKVPSLRNIEKTMPYMHNGTLQTIDDVLNHYQSGIVQTPNLDPLLGSNFSLTNLEKERLKAFLLTLTDEKFLKNPDFSEQ
ncbi:cytochrome-c peroxidase [Sphingobacteriales bacterium UPWRP_1]|nr:hypothetical protein B6N25_02540 [Sphingobacteriales bacterium TSM_CSS]PSJ72248.1 cytochrome-c peroxidase [Sphingobacteriales bacterium UPWRP_1]